MTSPLLLSSSSCLAFGARMDDAPEADLPAIRGAALATGGGGATRRVFLTGLAGAALLHGGAQATPSNHGRNASAIALASDPVLGNPRGDVTLVDFFDLQCPACRAMEPRIMRMMAADHGLRYVPVDYPVFGPLSELGARALLAAQSLGHYGDLHGQLVEKAGLLSTVKIKSAVEAVGLDWHKLQSIMAGPAISARIATNLARGKALGITRLPVMFLGPITIPGELHYADMADLLRSARKQQNHA